MLISFDTISEAEKSRKEYKPGVYTVRIIDAEEGMSRSGNEFLKVEFETMGEEVFKVKHWFFNTEKAVTILLNFLEAVGLYDKDAKKAVEFETDDLLGLVLKVEFVKGEENENGKSYLQLKPWSCKAVEETKSKSVKSKKSDSDIIDEDNIPF